MFDATDDVDLVCGAMGAILLIVWGYLLGFQGEDLSDQVLAVVLGSVFFVGLAVFLIFGVH